VTESERVNTKGAKSTKEKQEVGENSDHLARSSIAPKRLDFSNLPLFSFVSFVFKLIPLPIARSSSCWPPLETICAPPTKLHPTLAWFNLGKKS
jgi:hypothetical protein